MTLKADFLSTTFLKGAGELLFFAFLALLTRYLGAEDGGVVIQFIGLLMWIGPVAILGSQNIISKYTAIYFSEGKKRETAELIIFAHVVLLLSLLLALPLFVYLAFRLADVSVMYMLLPLTIFGWGSMLIFRELHRASERIILSEGTFQILKFALPFISLIVLSTDYLSVDTVLFALLTGLVVIFIINSAIFVNSYGFVTTLKTSWLHELFVHGPTVMLRLTLERSDIVLIGFLVGPAAAAVYAVAARIATIPTLFLDPIRNVLRPRIAKSYYQGEVNDLRRILQRSSLLLTASTIVIVAPILLFPQLIYSVFGALDADSLGIVLVTLLVGRVSNAVFGLNGPLLIMTNHHAVHLRIIAVVALAYFVVLFALPEKTLLSIAVLNSLMWFALNIALLIACKYRLGFSSWLGIKALRFH